MSGKRILTPRYNLALRNCRIAVHLLLPPFQEIATSFFQKRLRVGILPLTPYNTTKGKNDGLSGKDFSRGSVFPDNKAFRNLRSARCLIDNGKFPSLTYQYRRFPDLPKMGAKKQQIFFGFTALCAAAVRGYSVVNNKRGGALWATPLQMENCNITITTTSY